MARRFPTIRLLALLVGLMTCVSPVRFEAACAQETQALDFGALKRMPESEVIRLGTLRYTAPAAAPAYAKDHDRTLAKLAELDPALRRLVLTEFVAQFARPDLKWEPDDREHLVYFFDLWWGDFAPEVRDALREVGLEVQANVLSEAIRLFGQDYPKSWGRGRDAHVFERHWRRSTRNSDRSPITLEPSRTMFGVSVNWRSGRPTCARKSRTTSA